MTPDELRHLFAHHPPSPEKLVRHDRLRAAAKEFATALVATVPAGEDRDCALRHIRDALMTGNAAIALNPSEVPGIFAEQDTLRSALRRMEREVDDAMGYTDGQTPPPAVPLSSGTGSSALRRETLDDIRRVVAEVVYEAFRQEEKRRAAAGLVERGRNTLRDKEG